MSTLELSPRTLELAKEAQAALREQFDAIDEMAERNSRKVLAAFQAHRVSEACFAGTTGYGYDDLGRDTLDKIYADIFQTEDALVRIQFVNGTHAIASCLYGVLEPGDVLLSAVGAPYDTIQGVIGMTGDYPLSLKRYGIEYREVPISRENTPDRARLAEMAADPKVKAVLIQRSKGYSTRASLSVREIGELIAVVKSVNPEAVCIVDNCYGEFVEEQEPSQVGADLVVGSLIKNPGGGLAPMGGYLCGRADLVERASYRLTVPGIGRECGATLGNNRALYQGLFLAPHAVAQALKTAIFAARIMEQLGYVTKPHSWQERHDIIQMISLQTPERVEQFCKGIQAGSPVDSYVTPVPWAMPGYDVPVIMAAGAFIQGASIELSADAPMREPYTVYLQGGLTYESGKTGILLAVEELLKNGAD
ncbi:MAG: methionine gamma-lyase family protein [Clostridiales bacterium]|nr:methionine gamma-lyase family protein [Clostridiales bacterium]